MAWRRRCAEEVDTLGERRVYEEIDLPLVPVLLGMEKVGVRIDLGVLEQMADRLAADMQRVGEEIFSLAGQRFNINSPKQLGDVLFNKMGLPRPLKYGKGKVISTAQDVLEELAAHNDVPRLVLEYRQLTKLKSNYADSLPLLADSEGRVHTTFNQVGTATGTAVVDESEPAEYSDSDGAGAGDSRGVYCCAGMRIAVGGLFAD